MKRILLTGATGFIGSHLLESLGENGYEIVVLKRSTSSLWRIENSKYLDNTIDIDCKNLSEVFSEKAFFAVIHLATNYVKDDNAVSIKEMYDSNVTFPSQLIELASRNGVKCFINTGTFFEYDCKFLPVVETSKISPFNLYAKTKVAFENVIQTYSGAMDVFTLRLFSPYGEKDNEKIIPYVICNALKGEKVFLSDGLQKLDFIYVKDIVSAYIKLLDYLSKKQKTGSYEVFNLGSGFPVSVREIVSIVSQQLGSQVEVVWGAPSAYDIPIAYSCNQKLLDYLSWSPNYSIHEGIRNTIKYYRDVEGL